MLNSMAMFGVLVVLLYVSCAIRLLVATPPRPRGRRKHVRDPERRQDILPLSVDAGQELLSALERVDPIAARSGVLDRGRF